MPAIVRSLNRRHLLRLTLSAAVVPAASAGFGNPLDGHGEQFPVASLNHALTQSLIALGAERFGATAARDYAAKVVEPALPPTVIDIGTTAEPNLELLAEARPRFILHSPEWSVQPSALQRIAPVVALPIFQPGTDPVDNARVVTARIGDLLGISRTAAAYTDRVQSTLAALREEVAPFRDRPLLALTSPTPRQMWADGRGSLFDATLRAMGLRNAIREQGDGWGFVPFALKDIAAMESVTIVHFGPVPQRTRDNPFWNALPAVRHNRLVVVPEQIWMWGGLPSVERLARALAAALKAS
ncbi:ABC transporter substrate-binding protein [Pseudochelatococcus sp. B33]